MNLESVAIVILNYNGKHWLEQFLPFVIQYSGNAHIIVADNHSTDDSLILLREKFKNVDIIEIHSNLGFCGGYNFALRQVKEKYYVLLNSDVEVTQHWVEPIIQLFEANKNIAAAQPKILSYQQRNLFEYAGGAGGFIDTLGYPFCRGRIFNELEEDNGQYDDTRPVFWATGACLFIRSELYHQMGGLDEDFFAHMEEIDLCWRLHRAGYEVYYHAQSKVFHVGGGTLAASNPRKTYYNFRNGLSLIYKNLAASQLVWKLPLRLLLDWVAAFKFLLGGSWPDFIAVAKAHIHFFAGLRKEGMKRKKWSELLRKEKVPALYKGILIVDFFLLGRKKFSKLKF